MTVCIISHLDCALHEMGEHHPECPARLSSIQDQLIASGLDFVLLRHNAPLANREQLSRMHDINYIDSIFDQAPAEGRVWLDPDTNMNSHSGGFACSRCCGTGCRSGNDRVEPRIFFCSSFQHPFYPNTGA